MSTLSDISQDNKGWVYPKSASLSNNGWVYPLNPNDSRYFSQKDATFYTLIGPSVGPLNFESGNFTVALPVGGEASVTVTVSPSSGGGGGTFTPATVNLTTASPSATFTYTADSVGDKTISTTNNRGLINPGNLIYTAIIPIFSTTLMIKHTLVG